MRSLVVIMLPKSKRKIPWLLYQKDLEAPLVLVRHLFKKRRQLQKIMLPKSKGKIPWLHYQKDL